MNYCKSYIITALLLAFGVVINTSCNSKKEMKFGSDISLDAKNIQSGKETFNQLCASCHNFRQNGIGPNLSGLTRTIPSEWIKRFIATPGDLINAGDERAKMLFEQYNTYMPAFGFLQDSTVNSILSYLHTYEELPSVPENAEKPIKDPIPQRIEEDEQVLKLKLYAEAPFTSKNPPFARINKMECDPATERLFMLDIRGVIYEMKDKTFTPYFEIRDFESEFIDQPGLGTGLGSFALHPDFATNGLFYTSHTERADTKKADFAYEDSVKVGLQWVVMEWKNEIPNSRKFTGAGREIMRIDFVHTIHGMQELTFNPFAERGTAEYGKLYIGLGDGATVENGYPHIVNHFGTKVWGSILRIDPQGSNSKNGSYGIPSDNSNVNVSDGSLVPEIWAYGFRNPNKILWDEDGRMIATDIGQANIEEINIIEPGNFYGWPIREGSFVLNPKGNISEVFALPEKDEREITYPYYQYDHDEGGAIGGGYFSKIDSHFKGNYIFGDIPTGYLYSADLSSAVPVVKKINISLNDKPTSFKELTQSGRVDLRFGKDCEGNLYFFTKADGKIYSIE